MLSTLVVLVTGTKSGEICHASYLCTGPIKIPFTGRPSECEAPDWLDGGSGDEGAGQLSPVFATMTILNPSCGTTHVC